MLNKSTVQLMALGLVGSFAATAAAQDSGALIDALVRKGVLKDQEAEQIRSQLSKDFAANTPAGKLNISSSVKELKLSGDIRLRYQYDQKDSQVAGNLGANANTQADGNNISQRSRYRLRLRVNADYKLADDFFAGFGLQTTANNDSGNQTMGGAQYFQNYGVYINKAFIGWTPVPAATLVGGKQPNPFYTTDLVWDPDINPAGFVERFDLHKAFNLGGLELSIVGGQLIVSDNDNEALSIANQNGSGSAGSASSARDLRDAWIHQYQIIAGIPITGDVKFTIAPGYFFTEPGRVGSVAGGEGNATLGANAVDTLSSLKVLLLPGDISTKVAGKPVKFLWDIAYNLDGYDRLLNLANNASQGGLVAPTSYANISRSDTDKLAWLAGFQIGENKKKGDWSVSANYRQVGASSIDHNINDSDWALSFTNMQGFKVGMMYNLGDATTIGVTYYDADNLRKDFYNGNTPSVNTTVVSPYNSVQVLQVDMSVKF